MLTSIVDACEERAVGMCATTGACFNANMDEFLLMKVMGEQVDVICGTIEEYKQHAIK